MSAKDKDTEVLETYGRSDGWLDGKPAAITRKVGKGRSTYIGAWFDGSAMAAAAKWMTGSEKVKPRWERFLTGSKCIPVTASTESCNSGQPVEG